MRKNMFFAAISSLAAVFAVSCVKETPVTAPGENQVEPGFKEVTLTAGVPTKVNSLDDVVRWNSGEEDIAVFGQIGDEMVKYKFTKPSGSASITADFTGTVSENADLKYAAYPYNGCNCTSAGVFTMSSTESQHYYLSNSIPIETPLYAAISGETVQMKSACAYLKITLPGSKAIFKTVKVEAENISGSFTVDCTGDAPLISGGTKDNIQFEPKDKKAGNVYVPVIPGAYDDITITVEYTDGYPAFVRRSTSSNTFVAGNFYECKEVSGARVESVTSGECAIEGTSLTMNASAVVWKYSGVTNDAYTAKFYYAEQGIEKGAEGWNEVEAVISGDEGNDVALSATATIESGKSYQYYASISDGTETFESEVVAAVVKEKKSVTFDFTGDDEVWAYTDPASGEMVGAYKIVDENGNDVFPTFYPGNNEKTSYYYKEWNGSEYGGTTKNSINSNSQGIVPTLMVGGKLTKTVDGVNYGVEIGIAGTNKYYTYFSNLLCAQEKVYLKMICPDKYRISSVKLYWYNNSNSSTATYKWGIGTGSSSPDISKQTEYSVDPKSAFDTTIQIDGIVDTPYYLISGKDTNRLGSLTITYEK